ncbi:SEC10/PgrA surface exclusion domain-containing protein [Limosilactobacillus fastidiosus]|uniref:SEC10/PgrA surface exclusion domain-containing protein n=1 Tax=Limosilactobacillus fastidiosus TaxID=2759855 RepID=A0ABR6E7I1_9LACO|nr:SEC10/PgrA surface exclusion domain-containing protein [Limosilactobacillus fastidiosus]MBB1063135.1 SEC10/PgrA surface exclusion domain-containing protein [Limosilactobacillus fastidiosus]MCD7084116.1 SEC10/PgrA surface exclusion domain-containing protein [Limosilactobacillus fastidiosus]
MKSRKRISNKVLVGTVAMTGATLFGASTLNAQADTIQQNVKNNDTNINPQTPQQAAQQRVDNAQQQVTTQQGVISSGVLTVNRAQNVVNSDQAAVSAQQSVVNSATAEASSASVAVDNAITSVAQNQSNVRIASNAVTAANSAVSAQQEVVNGNSAQVDNDHNAINSAFALQSSAEARLSDYLVASQAAATSAFNFALANAQEAVNDQQQAVSVASKAVTAAQDAVQAQQNAVSIAQQTASEAAQQVAKDASAVAAAQQHLTTLKNNNDDVTATAQLQSTISQLQRQLANDKRAAQNAQQLFESAQQNFNHATATQKAAEERISQARVALAGAQQAVANAKANAAAAQQRVAQARADALKALETYNNYKNDNGVPTIQTPSDIVQQYENYLNNGRHNDSQIKADCAEGLALNGADPKKGLMVANWTTTDNGETWQPTMRTNYQATAQDEAETVNPRNMTVAQQTEITKFAAQIVNDFRESFQSTAAGAVHSYGKVKVSPYATELGNQVVASAYNNSGWNKLNNASGSPHNETGLITAANEAGLKTGFVGENLSSGLLLDPAAVKINQKMTMAEVKQSIYASILAMIYQDVEVNDGDNLHYGFGGHTEAFLNDPKGMNAISNFDNGNQYMTVTIDKDGWVHYNFFDDGQSSQAMKDKLAQGAITPENTTTSKITIAHSAYLQKKAAVTTAQTAATAAQNGVTIAQSNLADAQSAVDAAVNTQQKAANELLNQKKIMANAQVAVDIATNNISSLQAKLDKAQADLNAINGSVQDKARQLAQAEVDLNTAQQKLNSSKNVQSSRNIAVQDANAKLGKLQQIVQDKQNELQHAQNELQNKKNEYSQLNSQIRLARIFGTSLNAVSPRINYEKAITNAKKVVADAQQKLIDDTRIYQASQVKFQELVAKASQLQTIYQATLSNAKKSDAVQNNASVKKAKAALHAAQLKIQVENGKLTQLKGTLSTDETKLDQANGNLTKAQEKLNNCQNELKRAQITLDGLNHSYVPIKALNQETVSEEKVAADTTTSEAGSEVISQIEEVKNNTEITTSESANKTLPTNSQEINEVAEVSQDKPTEQFRTNEVQNPGRLNRASEEASIKSEIAAQIAARNAHAANDNMMVDFDDPYDNYYDQQQEAASIPSAPLEGYTRQLGALKNDGMINTKLEAAIKSGQIKLPSNNTKSEKQQLRVNKDGLTTMTVVAAGAALATGASLNKKRKKQVAKKLADNR